MRALIVIPTYNRAHIIGRAVRAALDQTQADARVLVVDDGSTDATADALRPFLDHPRFGLLVLARNGGTGAAKNAALALARFDAVTFHDSDDVPHADKLLRQLRILSRSRDIAEPCLNWEAAGGPQRTGEPARIELVLTAHRLIMADGTSARIARTLSLVDDVFPNLQFAAGPPGDWVLINCGLWRRDLLARTGGFDRSVEEDRCIRNRALMHGANIWFVDEPLLTKYEEADSLTATGATGYVSARRMADRRKVWDAITAWRRGGPPQTIPIDLPSLGLAFVSRPNWLDVAGDLPMTDASRRWLTDALAGLGVGQGRGA